MKKQVLTFLIMLLALGTFGCSSREQTAVEKAPSATAVIQSSQATATITLQSEIMSQATSTLRPSQTPLPEATQTAEAKPIHREEAPTPIATQHLEAAVSDGQVYLGDLLLLDTATDTPGCFGVGEISYSPTREYFLVVIACFEGDNEAFLFNADGSNRRRITGKWNYINYFDYEWASDGQSFTYERINSCCADPPPDAPPPGPVRYDIQTGTTAPLSTPASPAAFYYVVYVSSDDVLNVRTGPGVDNPVIGVIPHDGTGIQITGSGTMVEDALWVPIQYQDITGWVNSRYLAEQ